MLIEKYFNLEIQIILSFLLILLIALNNNVAFGHKRLNVHRHRYSLSDFQPSLLANDEEWNINEWWATNIKEDEFYAESNIDPVQIGPFVQMIKKDSSHGHYYPNDLQMSDSEVNYSLLKRNISDNETFETSASTRYNVIRRRNSNEAKPSHKKIKSTFPNAKLSYPISKPFEWKNYTGYRYKILRETFRKTTNKHDDNNNNNIDNNHSVNDEIKFSHTFRPKSSLLSIKSLFYEYFTNIRSNLFDKYTYLNLKKNLRSLFIDYGLQTAIQGFYNQKRGDKGHNIVGIYPGTYRNTTKKHLDSILVIGAHYDTVPKSPGVDDNGSGSVAVLELARLLHKHQCKLNMTIIFVLFDMEEDGLVGSKHFVKNYLMPVEKYKHGLAIKGAIIMDMILEYDNRPNSQTTQQLGTILPNWHDRVRQNQFRGDFAAVWARRDIDTDLYKRIEANWMNIGKYKLFQMNPPLPRLGQQLTSSLNTRKFRPYSTFLRSDHSSFWYPHTMKNETINAVLLTDLGPWRRKMANKYHTVLDNSKLLTRSNLLFLKNAIDSIMATILDISNGFCQETPD